MTDDNQDEEDEDNQDNEEEDEEDEDEDAECTSPSSKESEARFVRAVTDWDIAMMAICIVNDTPNSHLKKATMECCRLGLDKPLNYLLKVEKKCSIKWL